MVLALVAAVVAALRTAAPRGRCEKHLCECLHCETARFLALYNNFNFLGRKSYAENATWVWFDVGPYGSNAFHAHRDKLSE